MDRELEIEQRRTTRGRTRGRATHKPHKPDVPTCARRSCERPATKASDLLSGPICREHAAAERAAGEWRRRKEGVRALERNLRTAWAAGDQSLVRRWEGMLDRADTKVVEAEAKLHETERMAWSAA